jgi:hypothetical protein
MVDRRKHKRYLMPRGTFVILRNKLDPLHNHAKMSIGEIAMVLYKSDRHVMGQVTDMSIGGVAFRGGDHRCTDAENVELDLLMTEQGIYLHNIPYEAVAITTAGKSEKMALKFRKNVLRFKDLNTKQKGQLKELLTHHVR